MVISECSVGQANPIKFSRLRWMAYIIVAPHSGKWTFGIVRIFGRINCWLVTPTFGAFESAEIPPYTYALFQEGDRHSIGTSADIEFAPPFEKMEWGTGQFHTRWKVPEELSKEVLAVIKQDKDMIRRQLLQDLG